MSEDTSIAGHSGARFFDRDPGNLILPFEALVARLAHVESDLISREWRISHMDYGHGERVCALEDEVEEKGSVVLSGQALMSLPEGDDDEWFEDIDVEVESLALRFGRFDSSFLYVEGPEALVRAVAAHFTNVGWRCESGWHR